MQLGRRVLGGVDLLLVDEGVDRHGGLAGLPVADNQFALAAPDRHQGVQRLQAGLHRLVHRAARDNAGRLDLDARPFGRLDRALAVDRIAQAVDHAAEQAGADRHVDDGPGPLDRVALANVPVVAEDHDADIVDLEIERHALDAAGELDHLAGLDIVQPVDPGDAVADRQHLADLGDIGFRIEVGDLLLQDCGDFSGLDVHALRLPSSQVACAAVWS